MTTIEDLVADTLHRHGFVSGEIHLPNVDLTVKIPNDWFILYEWTDKHIAERYTELANTYGYEPNEAELQNAFGAVSTEIASCENYEFVLGFVIMQDLKYSKNNTFLGAHEEAHLLWELGEQDKIFNRFENPQYVKSKVKETEIFAHLSELHSFYKYIGLNPNEFGDDFFIDYALGMDKHVRNMEYLSEKEMQKFMHEKW